MLERYLTHSDPVLRELAKLELNKVSDIKKDFFIYQKEIEAFPSIFKSIFNLTFMDCEQFIEFKNETLEIQESLVLNNCPNLKKLPQRLIIGGILALIKTPKISFIKNQEVKCQTLILNNSKLNYLPKEINFEHLIIDNLPVLYKRDLTLEKEDDHLLNNLIDKYIRGKLDRGS